MGAKVIFDLDAMRVDMKNSGIKTEDDLNSDIVLNIIEEQTDLEGIIYALTDDSFKPNGIINSYSTSKKEKHIVKKSIPISVLTGEGNGIGVALCKDADELASKLLFILEDETGDKVLEFQKVEEAWERISRQRGEDATIKVKFQEYGVISYESEYTLEETWIY